MELTTTSNYELTAFNDKIEFKSNGLIISDALEYGEWENIGKFLKTAEKAVQWWLGDWLNFGEHKYGEMYAQALDETDYEYQTLRIYKWVASKIELFRRLNNLSFGHHQEVAILEPEPQKYWLDRAEENKWSVHELRRKIKGGMPKLTNRPQNNKIEVYHGDMLEILPTLGKFDLIIADPPYNVTPWEWDKIGSDFLALTEQWLKACKNALKEQYHLFWFCSPTYSADIEIIIRNLELPIKSRIVWHRRNMAMGSDAKERFIDTWEMIFHIGNRQLNFSPDWNDERFDVQTFAVPQTNFDDMKLHPTQKPLGLIEWIIRHGSFDGDIILDPFAGSGTTGAACQNRDCILIEKELEYIKIINERLGLQQRLA